MLGMMTRGTAGREASVRAPRRERGARHVGEAVAIADHITVAVKDIAAESARCRARSRVPRVRQVSTARFWFLFERRRRFAGRGYFDECHT